jgi:predicted hydrolase (HD superfamily)
LLKKTTLDTNLVINTGARLSKEDERELVLNEILYDIDNDYMKSVVVVLIHRTKK